MPSINRGGPDHVLYLILLTIALSLRCRLLASCLYSKSRLHLIILVETFSFSSQLYLVLLSNHLESKSVVC